MTHGGGPSAATQTLARPAATETNHAGVKVRPYRPADHNACRRLWGELVEHRAELYPRGGQRDGDRGGTDASAGFEEYLTRLDLSGLWVADSADGVVGFIGLTLDGSAAAIDPVIVTRPRRGRGIGRALLSTVASEARRRNLAQLTVSPSARDHAALRSLRAAGFGAVTSVTLTFALRGGQSSAADDPLDLAGLRFHA
jgi:GNAT superfamily N-acetyltransferase